MTLSLAHGYVSHVTKPEQIPNEPHFAILLFKQEYVSTGWEKPGEAGAPITVVEYHAFATEEAWRAALVELYRANAEKRYVPHDVFVGIRVAGRAAINVNVDVKVV